MSSFSFYFQKRFICLFIFFLFDEIQFQNNFTNNNPNTLHRPRSWMKKSFDGEGGERTAGNGLQRYSYNFGEPVARKSYQQGKW